MSEVGLQSEVDRQSATKAVRVIGSSLLPERSVTAQDFLRRRVTAIDRARNLGSIRSALFADPSTDILVASQVFFEDTGRRLISGNQEVVGSDGSRLGNIRIPAPLEESFFMHTTITNVRVLERHLSGIQASLANLGYEITQDEFGWKIISKQVDGRTVSFSLGRRKDGVDLLGTLDERDFNEAVTVASLFFPDAFASPQELRDKLSEAARKKAAEPKAYEPLRRAAEFLSDQDIRGRLDQDTAQAIELINALDDDGERRAAFEILDRSLENLPRVLANLYFSNESNQENAKFLEKVKEMYLQEAATMRISRSGDHDDFEPGELRTILNGVPMKTFYTALTSPSSGEAYLRTYAGKKGKPRNRIQYHYKDKLAVRCAFYMGDVDHPDSSYTRLGSLERHALSFVDAKLLESFLDAEDAITGRRELYSLMGGHIIEGRITDRPVVIKPEDLSDIEIPKKLANSPEITELKVGAPDLPVKIV